MTSTPAHQGVEIHWRFTSQVVNGAREAEVAQSMIALELVSQRRAVRGAAR